jgi:hypothetical protein
MSVDERAVLRDDEAHRRPEDAGDLDVEAAGKVSEALEWIERARGQLYTFHQLIGHADFMLDEAVQLLERAERPELAELVRTEVIGRNVLDGRWTFQIVEEFDEGYYATAVEADRRVRTELVGGKRHVFEAELKERRRSTATPGHEFRPPEHVDAPETPSAVEARGGAR